MVRQQLVQQWLDGCLLALTPRILGMRCAVGLWPGRTPFQRRKTPPPLTAPSLIGPHHRMTIGGSAIQAREGRLSQMTGQES
jgi:hypothetical protein